MGLAGQAPTVAGALASTTLRYVVDSDDRLETIGGPWDAFAFENGAPELAAGRLRGRSLWDFVHGDAVQAIYQSLLSQVRQTFEPLEFRYRCDSASLRRFMRMRLVPEEAGQVEFVSETLRIEPRSRSALGSAAGFGARPLVARCSFCTGLRVGGKWTAPDEATRDGGVFEKELQPMIAYGVCDECRGELVRLRGVAR